MNVSRFVSLAAAVVISAVQWGVLFNPTLQMQSVRAVVVPVVRDVSDASLPVVVVTAHRQS